MGLDIVESEKNFKHQAHPKYRPDIDGLRALAVLSVVGFHAFPEWITGGFIGVDIFFVISGFLISTIIFGSLDKNVFSFKEFYSRRIRRIFPALIPVLAVCAVFGWFALLADEYKSLGKHIAGGAGFISNLILWRESGAYFDNAAETKPLLHLWSLGIEEQFYIVWPILLWLTWKARFNILVITVTLVVISFASNLHYYSNDPVSNFYSPLARFWELLAGAILAYFFMYKPNWLGLGMNATETEHIEGASIEKSVMSTMGLLFVISGLWLISREKYFPGLWVMLPVFGTILIIAAGPHAWVNRNVLASRVLVWFGLISYPLYLWHWPILSFLHIVESEPPPGWLKMLGVIFAILLAWITWKLIEKPIRSKAINFAAIASLLFIMISLFVIGVSIFVKDGFPTRELNNAFASRLPATAHKKFFKYISDNFPPCTPKSIRESTETEMGYVRCAQSRQDMEPTIALVGDSHGEALFIGIAENFGTTENIVNYQFRCLPFWGVSGNPQCQHMNEALDYIAATSSIHTVVLAASWPGKIADPNWRLDAHLDINRPFQRFEVGLLETLEKLKAKGKKIVVIGDTPAFPFDPIRCGEGRPFSLPRPQLCSIPLDKYVTEHQESWASINRIVPLIPSATFVNILPSLCNNSLCSMKRNDQLLFRDNDHLTVEGSKLVGGYIAEQIRKFISR